MALNGPTYYPQYFAVIAYNVEHCGFGSTLPLEESHITPGIIYPQFGNHYPKRTHSLQPCANHQQKQKQRTEHSYFITLVESKR